MATRSSFHAYQAYGARKALDRLFVAEPDRTVTVAMSFAPRFTRRGRVHVISTSSGSCVMSVSSLSASLPTVEPVDRRIRTVTRTRRPFVTQRGVNQADPRNRSILSPRILTLVPTVNGLGAL